MTVRALLGHLATRLQAAGVESARLEAEWLTAHVLGVKRMALFLDQGRELAEREIGAIEALAVRRESREPLQHILGTAEFCGRVFTVNRHVLIPRPETELLAQWAVKVGHASSLSPWSKGGLPTDGPTPGPSQEGIRQSATRPPDALARFPSSEGSGVGSPATGPSPRILDFGTGSGCLAITLALDLPDAEVHAVDVSPDAMAMAKANAKALGADTKITFHLGDGFHPLPTGLKFDFIVTNPPYIPSAEIATLQPEVRDFDPAIALDGGADGLEFYRHLATEAPVWLKPGGQLVAEFGEGQGPDLRTIFEQAGWAVASILPDDTGRERMLHAKQR